MGLQPEYKKPHEELTNGGSNHTETNAKTIFITDNERGQAGRLERPILAVVGNNE